MTSSQEFEAACTCGRLRIRLSGQPRLVSSCHCLACQRRTGALFGSGAFFARDQVVRTEGECRTYTRRADSGAHLPFRFLPNCRSTVFWANDRVPETYCVAGAAFAGPTCPGPVRTVWTVSKHGCLPFPGDIPHPAKSPP